MPKEKKKKQREKYQGDRDESCPSLKRKKRKYEEKESSNASEREITDTNKNNNSSQSSDVMVVDMSGGSDNIVSKNDIFRDGGKREITDIDLSKFTNSDVAKGSAEKGKLSRRRRSRESSLEVDKGKNALSEGNVNISRKEQFGRREGGGVEGVRGSDTGRYSSSHSGRYTDKKSWRGGYDTYREDSRYSRQSNKDGPDSCDKKSTRRDNRHHYESSRHHEGNSHRTAANRESGKQTVWSSAESDDYNDDDDQRKRKCGTNSDDDMFSQNMTENPRIQVYRTNSGVLLILSHPQEICLHGKCRIKSLFGVVSVLGFQMKAEEEPCEFYSPNTNSLLTIQTTTSDFSTEAERDIMQIYEENITENLNFEMLPKKDVAIILLEKLDSYFCEYIESFSTFQNVFSKHKFREMNTELNHKLSMVGVTLVPEDAKASRFRVSDDYNFILGKWEKVLSTDEAPIVVVCGGKNSGKSTLNRYLVNTTMNKSKKVYFLELDVGQTELTPPGCIALHTIDKPLLGPPFCHQRNSDSMYYYGGLTPNDNPDRYVSMVMSCLEDYRSKTEKLPLIVNTMGWNKGLGLDLMVDTLRLVCPSLVVQLDFKNLSLNFPPLTTDFVKREKGWTGKSRKRKHGRVDLSSNDLHHNLVIVESVRSRQSEDHSGFKPLDHRNLSLLGYLGSGLEPGMTLTSMQPYTIPMGEIAVNIGNQVLPPHYILSALNATVVGMCHADTSQAKRIDENLPLVLDKTPVCKCLGFGIVRGIDMEEGLLYILTPLTPVALARVNTLVRGATNLPEEVLMKQKGKEIPYVSMTTSTIGSSNLQQRRHMPRKDKHDLRW